MNLERYNTELSLIETELENLAKGNYYETYKSKKTAKASAIAEKTLNMFYDLIYKIENDKKA